MTPKFNRILLKLSGEVLAGEQGHGFDFDVIETICDSIAKVVDMGVSVGIVIGGGNFWRGRSSGSMDRCRADSIGMLGTVMNSIAVADTLIAKGVEAKVYSAVAMEPIAEIFTADKARADLDKGVVTIFGGGTGNPFFSTDSAAALRAAQIEAEVIFKATNAPEPRAPGHGRLRRVPVPGQRHQHPGLRPDRPREHRSCRQRRERRDPLSL